MQIKAIREGIALHSDEYMLLVKPEYMNELMDEISEFKRQSEQRKRVLVLQMSSEFIKSINKN